MTVLINGTTGITTPDLDSAADLSVAGITVGRGSGSVATNTAVGFNALAGNSTGATNVAVGYTALASNTASENTAVGAGALQSNTSGTNNSGFGRVALNANTTGSSNTAHGMYALFSNTTASNNTAAGYQAGYANTTGQYITAIGGNALQSNTIGNFNTVVGYYAGNANTIGATNAYFGAYTGAIAVGSSNTFLGVSAGEVVTTGSKNTILGRYSGNQGGLNITTISNYIVLSDGDGNPRLIMDGSGILYSPRTYTNTSGGAANVGVGADGAFYRSTSALKYKQDIRNLEEMDISLLRPVRYKSKCENDDPTKDHLGLIADEAADAGFEELITRGANGEVEGFQYERLTVVLLKELQTLRARVTALEGN